MKRFIPIYIATLLLAIPSMAQQIMEGTGEVKNLETIRKGEKVVLNMDIDISKLEIGADETVVLTPVVEKNGNELVLPAVEVMGRRQYIYHMRNDNLTATEDPFYAERKAKRAERKAGEKQVVNYTTEVAFQEWMRGAKVKIQEGSCGCNPEVLALGENQVGRFLHEIYSPNYLWSFIEPEPEPVKVRDESLSAYINFKVDQYEILEEYKNNDGELAAMINSIKRVEDDADLTITSISIEGWASPEATEKHNQRLSQNRANSLADYVAGHTGIDRSHIEAVGCGEDWAGLKREVENTPKLLNQDKVLAIIAKDGLSLDEKESQLKKLEPVAIYNRLLDELYPRLRRNDYHIIYNVRNFDLEEARALVDSNPRKLSLGELYKVAGSYEKGSKEYNHVMEVTAKTYPSVVAAAVNAAAVKMEAKDYDGALAILSKSAQDDSRILVAQGNAYVAKDEVEKAREAWSKAAQKGNADAKHNLAELEKYVQSL